MNSVSKTITSLSIPNCRVLHYKYHKVIDPNNQEEIVKLKKIITEVNFGLLDVKAGFSFVGETDIENDDHDLNPRWFALPSMGMVIGIYDKTDVFPTFNIDDAISEIQQIVQVHMEPIDDPIQWLEHKHYIQIGDDGYDGRELMKRLNAA